MKTVAFGISGLAIVMVVLVALLQIVTLDTRTTTFQASLRHAMESSLDTAIQEHAYSVADEEQLVADVIEGITLSLGEGVDLTVQVNGVDQELGLLSLTVEAVFPGASESASSPRVVRVDKTVVLEHTREAESSEDFVVTFTDPLTNWGKTYRFTADSGQNIPFPIPALVDGWEFTGWRSTTPPVKVYSTSAQIGALPLQDYSFVAIKKRVISPTH